MIVNGICKINGVIELPGDKSISHRALMLSAISDGLCHIDNMPQSHDINSTIKCLRQLGALIDERNSKYQVLGRGFRNFTEPSRALDCGNSGTCLRLLIGLLSASNITCELTGDKSLQNRPIGRVITPLEKMGATFKSLIRSDNCPVKVNGKHLNGTSLTLKVPSAQVKTAIMFAGLLSDGNTEIYEPIKTRDHTERLLQYLGVNIAKTNGKITLIPPDKINPYDIVIPGDPSSAAFIIVAAIINDNSRVVINKLLLNDTRLGYLKILNEMGANININQSSNSYGEQIGDITASSSCLKAVDVPAQYAPLYIDEVPILALAATRATGTSCFRGLSELIHKESNRLNNTMIILNRMGAKISVIDNDMYIEGPSQLQYYDYECYNDHRLAMMIEIGNLLAHGKMSYKYHDIISVSYKRFYEQVERILN